jgi:hypothetical protein
MKKRRAALKAEVMAEIEKAIEKGLDEAEKKGRLTLTVIEDIALQARGRVGEAMTAALAGEAGGAEGEGVCCPSCGARMAYKGQKKRYVRTRSGEVLLERAY